MKKETLTIKKTGINGEGVGYLFKKVTFVKGALKDEVVEINVDKVNSGFIQANLIKVKEASPHRVKPICSISHKCLACPLMIASSDYQKEVKKELIQEAFSKYTNYSFKTTQLHDVITPERCDHYRHDVDLPIVFNQGKVSVGIFQRDSKFYTYMSGCKMQEELVNLVLQQLEQIMNRLKMKIYDDRSKLGLRFLKLRHIDGDIQALFVTGKDGLSEEFIQEVKKIKPIKTLYYTMNTTRYQDFDLAGYKKVYGDSRLALFDKDKKYLVSLKSDLPIHLPMHFKMIQEVKHLIDDHSKKILSIRPGIGLLEKQLEDKDVVMIETNSSNYEDLVLNMKHHESSKIIKGDENECIVRESKKKIYDAFIIQNTKSLSDELKESIRLSKVKQVLWIGESYASMAKDLGELSSLYQLEHLIPYDGEPNSAKVYLIASLRRK